MRKSFVRLREALYAAGRNSVSMQRKMMIYLCIAFLAALGVLCSVLMLGGFFANDSVQLRRQLELQLKNTGSGVGERTERISGNGLRLSKELVMMLEKDILTYPYDIQSLNNEPEELLRLQTAAYPLLNTALQLSGGSGVYMVADATTNTAAPTAKHSRSGLYLRLANVSSSNAPESDVVLFRGLPEIARQKKLELHNRWNLEFDTEVMDWYGHQLGSESARDFFWTARNPLLSTWEDILCFSVPLIGSNGEKYGICGIELSSLLFRLSFPALPGEYGNMVTVLAPLSENKLLLSEGLAGDSKGMYLDSNAALSIHSGRYYNVYTDGRNRYVGRHQPISIRSEGGEDWVLCVLIDKSGFDSRVMESRMFWLGAATVLTLVMIGVSILLSRRFVRPIMAGIEKIKSEEGYHAHAGSSGISEIDELAVFLKERSERNRIAESELPPNIAELFDRFIESSGTLTGAEHSILNYYIEGHEISEIPELAYISMSTVRKHNRSIYEKLGVASRDEMMLYIDLIRRCGRIEELQA